MKLEFSIVGSQFLGLESEIKGVAYNIGIKLEGRLTEADIIGLNKILQASLKKTAALGRKDE